MVPFDDDPFEPSSSRDEKGKAVHNLLEEGWLYGKLLSSRPKMFRCYSDLSPNFGQETLAKNHCTEQSSTTRKSTCKLIRAPSLPPRLRGEEKFEEKESSSGMSELTRQFCDASKVQKPSEPACSTKKKGGIQEKVRHARGDKKNTGQSLRHNVPRKPTLPPCLGQEFEDIEDNESDITMSRLIREAMPNSLPVKPRQRASKVMIQ
uniref:Uncharacterized protein n=1 Tax=Rhizophora mucronata TaxID=61149 RepID=A0A2P2J9N1_RHIMU